MLLRHWCSTFATHLEPLILQPLTNKDDASLGLRSMDWTYSITTVKIPSLVPALHSTPIDRHLTTPSRPSLIAEEDQALNQSTQGHYQMQGSCHAEVSNISSRAWLLGVVWDEWSFVLDEWCSFWRKHSVYCMAHAHVSCLFLSVFQFLAFIILHFFS